jgi:DNA relaxase NicK
MNKSISIILAILTTSCFGNPQTLQGEITGPQREKLISVAKQELKRRNLPLPRDYNVVVENGKFMNEIDTSARELYGVSFTFTYRGKRDAFYSVLIDKGSGRIDQVSDLRKVKYHKF